MTTHEIHEVWRFTSNDHPEDSCSYVVSYPADANPLEGYHGCAARTRDSWIGDYATRAQAERVAYADAVVFHAFTRGDERVILTTAAGDDSVNAGCWSLRERCTWEHVGSYPTRRGAQRALAFIAVTTR